MRRDSSRTITVREARISRTYHIEALTLPPAYNRSSFVPPQPNRNHHQIGAPYPLPSFIAQSSDSIMFLTRFIGRTLFAAAKSETSAATAAAATATTTRNPLEEFFEADRRLDEDKPVVYGRSWKASELRLKSWDDLNKLWYVLLKEKNMLMTQRQMLHSQNLRFPNPERLPKVRKSMCRIKQVLTERAIGEPDPRRTAEMKRMINAL